MVKILVIYTLLSSFVLGWGKTGHRIVGKIAETYLTKNAKTQIKKLIGHHDLSRMSNWADEIKSDPSWKIANDWHWCTIPDGEVYEKDKHSGKAVEKVNEFISVLKNKKSRKEDRQIALKFLIHLIGDLHQPMHVGNGIDRGGNDIKLKWFNAPTNLHRIWDSDLINLQGLSYSEYSNYLMLNENRGKIRKWQGDDVLIYIHESRDMRTQCYDFSGENLKWEYFYKHKELLEKRLLQGGVRLSGELNRIFK
ncbi:MAG: S1/P1 nuclease [Candidatus Neomarinimicrobiota bacterium]